MDSWWESVFFFNLGLFVSICQFPALKDDLRPRFKGSAQAPFPNKKLLTQADAPPMA